MTSREQLAQWVEDGLRDENFRESRARYLV